MCEHIILEQGINIGVIPRIQPIWMGKPLCLLMCWTKPLKQHRQEPAWAKACLKAWFVTSLGNRKAVGNRQSTEAFQFRGHETQCFFSLFQRRGRCEALRQPLSQLLPLQLFGCQSQSRSKRKAARRWILITEQFFSLAGFSQAPPPSSFSSVSC